MAGLTLAQFRDAVRRRLQIEPPIDQGGSTAGEQPYNQRDPTNVMVNTAINNAINIINRAVRCGKVTTETVSVTADLSQRGSLEVDISGALPAGTTIVETENVNWDPLTGDSGIYRLEPEGYYDKQGPNYQQFQQGRPAAPRVFALLGNQVSVMPPPATNGAIRFKVASSLPPLSADSDTLSADLPLVFHDLVEYLAVVVLCARKGSDVEAQARMQGHLQLAAEALPRLYQNKNGYNADALQSIRDTLMMLPMGLGMSGGQAQPQPPQQGG